MTAVQHCIQQAVDDICGAKLCEVNSMSSRREMIRLLDCALAALRTAQGHLEPPVRRTGLPHCERSCEASAFQIEIRRLTALLEQPRRLTDDQIGRLWFEAKIPGLNEADARRLIRAVEATW